MVIPVAYTSERVVYMGYDMVMQPMWWATQALVNSTGKTFYLLEAMIRVNKHLYMVDK